MPPTIEFCREQQRRAMEQYKRTKDQLTEIWWADWFAEEYLMERELSKEANHAR